ncbi:hypothetical protein A8U91_00007 [Halomonas elongata]|uniref:Uncharacterized protein n=1 Tax=Halomonas elongata TaxID=2746 RepID=A0A1B8P089_HALEL|nr:hypothetical protein [Halomonas elongata]OBX35675.1 hypothetical protein A8U91_00007 [Halomonas elongata]
MSRNEQWVTASKGALASLKYSDSISFDKVTIALREAYDSASRNDSVRAANILEGLVNSIKSSNERGYLKQVFAEYTNLHDKSEAQKIQLSAVSDNCRVLKPIDGIQYHKISGEAFDQAVSCSSYLLSRQQDPNKLIIEVDGVLSDLKFREDSSNRFEESLKEVARYIGFLSQRPEEEFRKGPDVLWKIGELKYLVIEAKNEAFVDTISKGYCNQLNGSCNWFEEKYDYTCAYTPVMVHKSNVYEYAASPKQGSRIITEEKLDAFCKSVRGFIKSIASSNRMSDPAAIRESLISYKLRSSDFLDHYSVPYRVRNSS